MCFLVLFLTVVVIGSTGDFGSIGVAVWNHGWVQTFDEESGAGWVGDFNVDEFW